MRNACRVAKMKALLESASGDASALPDEEADGEALAYIAKQVRGSIRPD